MSNFEQILAQLAATCGNANGSFVDKDCTAELKYV
jgi:hypothetical protein